MRNSLSEPPNLTADQLDALREIVNIAMGRAADSLARLLDRFIELPVPVVRFVEASKVLETFREMIKVEGDVTAVRQAFTSVAPGECLVIFGATSFRELADLMGREGSESEAAETELLLDIANLLVGACVGGVGEQLGQEFSYSPPSIIVARAPIDQVLDPANVPWRTALLLEVNFKIEGKSFVAHVLIFWPEAAVARVRERLDLFLASLE